MQPITASLLENLAAAPDRYLVEALVPELVARLPAAQIDTPLRVVHFLAQACMESWGFARLSENLDYSATAIAETFPRLAARAENLAHNPQALANAAYAGRNGNGDEASRDGWRFRGRGLLCLTGRANYATVGEQVAAVCLGLDILARPDEAAMPRGAVASAVMFWRARHINTAADADDTATVTRLINGGARGLPGRLAFKRRALALLTAP